MNKNFEHKIVPTSKDENRIKPVNSFESTPLEDSEPIDIRLNVLNDYLKQCQENGLEITPEMAEKEIKENLGLNISELLDQEITDPEVKSVHREAASEIEAMMSQKATDQKTVLSFLREKIFKSNFAKAAFVTAILFLKFNTGFAADDVKDKDQSKTEFKKPVNLDGGDDKDQNYDSAPDFKETEKVTIKAGSFFETDKADLKNQAELQAKFTNFFSSISNDNFDKMMAHNWIFASSSDERQTSNWGGSNKNLTDARFEAFSQLFEETRAAHDFSGLSSDQVKQILDKPILNVQPAGGETHITDLVNSQTNKNYTAQEVAALNQIERAKLLDKCRYANFEVESTMFEVGTYGQFILLVDNSPSMKVSKVNMAEELKYINKDMPVKVAFFSNDLGEVKELNSSQAAADEIIKTPSIGSGAERAMSSAINYLENIEPTDISSKAMYVATDEGLQDFNKITKLVELSKKTKTDVTFLMFYEKGSKFVKVSANDLLTKFNKNLEANLLAKQELLSKNIVNHEKQISSLMTSIGSKLTSGSFDASTIFDLLAKDGIKGSAEEIKKALLEADFRSLKNFSKVYLGDKLVREKMHLMSDKILLANAQLPLEQQVVESQVLASNASDNQISKITSFEDNQGNKVEIPIYN